MYYMKNGKKKLFIEDDNAFTQCPRCGQEMQVDLADAVIDGSLDLYGTSWYCERCSKKVRKENAEMKDAPAGAANTGEGGAEQSLTAVSASHDTRETEEMQPWFVR